MTDRELIERIKAALETEEDGEALIGVARAACLAEMELAARERRAALDYEAAVDPFGQR